MEVCVPDGSEGNEDNSTGGDGDGDTTGDGDGDGDPPPNCGDSVIDYDEGEAGQAPGRHGQDRDLREPGSPFQGAGACLAIRALRG